MALGLGFAAGFFRYDNNNNGVPYDAFVHRKHGHKKTAFLTGLWLLCAILAVAAWLFGPQTHQLDEKLDILALFIILVPIIFTALPLYPLIALEAWRQSRLAFLQQIKKPENLLPLRFQTFAYPLPGFFPLFKSYSALNGVKETVLLMQKIQLQSQQEGSAARGAKKLANDPKWALPFCGTAAMFSNSATVAPLALAGEAARAAAVLARKTEKEDELPLRLFFGDYPPYPPLLSTLISTRLRGNADHADPALHLIEEFETARAQPLAARVEYALARLEQCAGYAQAKEFSALLHALLPCAQAKTVQTLESVMDKRPKIIHADEWLAQGWTLLKPFQEIAAELPEYRRYLDADSRRRFLEHLAGKLEAVRRAYGDGANGAACPAFWANIGTEIAEHWIALLKQEAEQAREWLKIEVEIPPQQLRTGHQVLALKVRNLSGVAARKLLLRVTRAEGLHCDKNEVEVNIPLERFQETVLHFTFSCEKTGTCLLQGEVIAEDISGASTEKKFSERLDIGMAGRSYELQKSAPYTAGEGLGDDRTFIERGELRHKIKALWQQPGGKPAILLVGQRRIGKSTLLNKILRDGLDDCGLWPLKIDMQGCNTPLGLLRDVARGMAKHLGRPAPKLCEADPFADFKDFLFDCPPPAGKRFLLMLDEAERIWSRLGTTDTADNLRALMQGAEYPVLLLFCGTHALQHIGRDYGSVLFNTAHTFTLSYMSESESRQVLENPAQNIVEYDPQALAEACYLTHGQPYLLQMLGTVIIERFDSAVLKKEPRSDYVSLRDMQQAADDLVKRGNAAFENYWQDADADTRKLYSVLAWATEQSPQLDLDGIAGFLREQRLQLPRAVLFERLETLSEQGLLHNAGPTYGFSVPLFRRWLVWRWPPDKVRMGTG
ncbi:MAG: ATP-binding protein [Gammaproteobacteria bacterium]|nr:ATP-binding protein [Gammaproteobacteria bacterium]